MKVTLKNVRLSFPALFEAKSVKGSKAAFSGAFIFSREHPAAAQMADVITTVAKEEFGDQAEAVLKSLKAADKLCVHDGDSKSEYDGYAGNLFINARNEVKPMVLDLDKTELVAADGKPYSGCYVDVSLDVWAQNNQYGKRVNAKLLGVRFRADGERLAGGATASADDFEEIPVEAKAAVKTNGAASLF